MKCIQCHKEFTDNVDSSSEYIGKKLIHFCSERCYHAYYKKKFVPYHKRKDLCFYHVDLYPSSKEFKKAVKRFLKNVSFADLWGDSFDFVHSMNYENKHQKTQIKALNNVFDSIYGINRVRWGYIKYNRGNPHGPYIVIDEETFFYYPKIQTPLDKFIRKRLKNVSNT